MALRKGHKIRESKLGVFTPSQPGRLYKGAAGTQDHWCTAAIWPAETEDLMADLFWVGDHKLVLQTFHCIVRAKR